MKDMQTVGKQLILLTKCIKPFDNELSFRQELRFSYHCEYWLSNELANEF